MHTDGGIYDLEAVEGSIFEQVEIDADNYLEEFAQGLYFFNDYVPASDADSITFRYYRPSGNMIDIKNVSVSRIRKGLTRYIELYQLTENRNVPVKPESSTELGSWSTDNSLQPTPELPYLWNCEIIIYSDRSEQILMHQISQDIYRAAV